MSTPAPEPGRICVKDAYAHTAVQSSNAAGGEAGGAAPGTTQGTTRADLTSPDPDRALGDPLAPRGPAAALRSGAGAGQLTWSPEGVARTGNPLESE